jgi:uridine kinase
MLKPLLVAIVGGSGAGKTWLAKKLEAALTPDAARFSLDDFYRDCSRLHPERRAKINFDHPRAIDWPIMERVLKDLRAGRAARLPCYDFKTHSRLAKTRSGHSAREFVANNAVANERTSPAEVENLHFIVGCSFPRN